MSPISFNYERESLCKRLSEILGVDSIHIVDGGPSIADPAGIINHFLSVRDKDKTRGAYIAISGGHIDHVGASIAGARHVFTYPEKTFQEIK